MSRVRGTEYEDEGSRIPRTQNHPDMDIQYSIIQSINTSRLLAAPVEALPYRLLRNQTHRARPPIFFLSYPYLSLSLGHRAWASRRLVPSCHQSTKVVILLFTPERRCDAFKLIATAALDSILYARAKTCSLP